MSLRNLLYLEDIYDVMKSIPLPVFRCSVHRSRSSLRRHQGEQRGRQRLVALLENSPSSVVFVWISAGLTYLQRQRQHRHQQHRRRGQQPDLRHLHRHLRRLRPWSFPGGEERPGRQSRRQGPGVGDVSKGNLCSRGQSTSVFDL